MTEVLQTVIVPGAVVGAMALAKGLQWLIHFIRWR